eukprot:ctg_361.g125
MRHLPREGGRVLECPLNRPRATSRNCEGALEWMKRAAVTSGPHARPTFQQSVPPVDHTLRSSAEPWRVVS